MTAHWQPKPEKCYLANDLRELVRKIDPSEKLIIPERMSHSDLSTLVRVIELAIKRGAAR